MSARSTVIAQCATEEQSAKKDSCSKGFILLRLLKMMGREFWVYLFGILTMSFAYSGFNTLIAFLLNHIITAAQTGDTSGLTRLILINIAETLGILILAQIGFLCYQIEAKRGCATLQNHILDKARKMPYDYYENTHSGDFMSKLMYDGSRTEDVYGSRFRRILMPCLMVIFYLIPMFALSWQVTLCLFAVSVATFAVNALFIKPMKKVSRELSETHTSLTERLSNILEGMELVKIFGLENRMVDAYVDDNRTFFQGQKKVTKLSAGLDSLNRFFDLMSSLVFIAMGIFFVSIGITTVGKLAAIYVMYGSMSWNFLQIGIYIPSMANCLTNASRVFEFLDMKEEAERFTNVEKASGDGYIEMEHIDFSYDGETKVLDDFSLHIEKGKTVALKGESGKGKSTIAKILLGLYPVQSGAISIAGKAFSEMTLEEIRGMIGYVPQEPYLYNVSIAENIGYGRPGATMDEIIAAAKAANAHQFILEQEQGYDTNAGERGNRLSGGEKQRIAIARAILKNAPILILDEATSALDNESERLVSEALEHLMQGRTTIMIAHRLSTLDRADEIIEI